MRIGRTTHRLGIAPGDRTEMPTPAELESMANELSASGNYRVLRRLVPKARLREPDGIETRLGIFIDLETTGLDPVHDEIIEIAMVPFRYGVDGFIYEVGEPFQRLRQPSKPIPTEVTALTGIDDAIVAGQVVTPTEVSEFASPATLIVAHNAAFDRRFAERFSDVFTTKAWACSMSQIEWAQLGFSGTKLLYLAADAGFFYDGHRAVHDCQAAVSLLATPLADGTLPFTRMLECARKPTIRIWAEHSPFELKDQLKARGYRWNPDATTAPRAWYIDVAEDAHRAEVDYLSREIYQRDVEPLSRRITAYDRFSERV